jgi:hypothetical protein
VLDLSYNQVESLHGFKGQLPKLVKLSLKKNKMNSLANIEAFPNVNYLKLSRNLIDSYAEVKKLAKLRSLKGVSLYDNPVGEDKRAYCIAVLQICPFLETLDHKSCLEVKKSHDIKEEDLLKRDEERKRVACRSPVYREAARPQSEDRRKASRRGEAAAVQEPDGAAVEGLQQFPAGQEPRDGQVSVG